MLEALRREGAGWAEEGIAGSAAWPAARRTSWGRQANAHPPVLRTHDRYGHRIDEVEFHPAWHGLMRRRVAHGLHGAPWREPRPGAHVRARGGFCVWSQVEAGHGCPVSMTYAAVPALRARPGAGRASGSRG